MEQMIGHWSGCRCSSCKVERGEYGRTCGRRSTYGRGCRCGLCREAERVYRRAYRARGKESA